MVRLNKIYTRTGDTGETSLGDGSRRRKDDPRIIAYGSVDELNASLGIAALHAEGEITQHILQIQNDLFDLGADLCVPENLENAQSRLRITQDYINNLEGLIDHYNTALAPLKSFVLPSGTPLAAALHVARTTARRAERDSISLNSRETINPLTLIYLNRLSDLLFVLARLANNGGKADILWQPGRK